MDWTNLIPWGISLITLIVVILTFARSGKKDYKENITEESAKMHDIDRSLTKVNTKLDQLCNTTVETRADIKAMSQNLSVMERRVTILETQLETVWKRIDELKEATHE